jgi:predicted metal-binding membrane protein
MQSSSPADRFASWAVMLLAMMSPVLTLPVQYIRDRTLTHRRLRATALFLGGYTVVWCAIAGLVVMVTELTAAALAGGHIPAAVAIAVASVWQCSPSKQWCLNRCHAHPRLGAFGVRADLAVLQYGLTHSMWCVGSCWALMLLPIPVPMPQVWVMAVAMGLIVGERFERPRAPRWALRGAGRAARMVAERARLGLEPTWRRLAGSRV